MSAAALKGHMSAAALKGPAASDSQMTPEIGALARRLGHEFVKPALLEQALLHAGAASSPLCSNERLEFLGDRVLGLIVAQALIERFPTEREGDLAKRLAHLASRDTLARIATSLSLGEAMMLSRGDEEAGHRANPSLLADALEAVIAALYLDGGLAAAHRFVMAQLAPLMAQTPTPPRDSKTRLQEWALARAQALPVYRMVSSEGPAHSPQFEIEVILENGEEGRGRGPSKRVAEQRAAQALLAALGVAE